MAVLSKRLPVSVTRWLRPRRLAAVTGLGVFGVGVILLGCVLWVRGVSSGYIYDPAEVPARPVALVLGSQVVGDTPSLILAARLETARALYEQGTVRAILVSGDNGEVNYNEVDPMRSWLIDHGVPETKVIGDYAGFDTYNSCVRAVEIFGVTEAVVVTQSYHLPRAIALCRTVGLDAVGARAGNGGVETSLLRQFAWRDELACVKAVGELVARPDPTYLGQHETGVEEALASD